MIRIVCSGIEDSPLSYFRVLPGKMTMGRIQNLDVQIPHEIIQYWGWFLAFGIALPLLGVVAVVCSVTATIVSILFFGWLQCSRLALKSPKR